MVDNTDLPRWAASIRPQPELEGERVFPAASVHDDMASSLTRREREILVWVANGKSYWETGQILGIAEGTVRIHLTSIRKKLNAANTTNAVAKAVHQRAIVFIS